MRFDPRSPLVLSTHDLGRRPGAMRESSLSAPAPADVGVGMVGVPEGSAVAFDLRFESVIEGVLVTGRASVALEGECARCLTRFEQDLEVTFQELFVYPESDAEDDEAMRLDGELLDLEPVLRDAVVLALPFQPVCRTDCPGLCTECGALLADNPGHTHEAVVDARWGALVGLRVDSSAAGAAREDEE